MSEKNGYLFIFDCFKVQNYTQLKYNAGTGGKLPKYMVSYGYYNLL